MTAVVWTRLKIGGILSTTRCTLPSLTPAVPTWLPTKPPVRLEALIPMNGDVTPSSSGSWRPTMKCLQVCLLLPVVCSSFAWSWPCGCCFTGLNKAAMPLSQRSKHPWRFSVFSVCPRSAHASPQHQMYQALFSIIFIDLNNTMLLQLYVCVDFYILRFHMLKLIQ